MPITVAFIVALLAQAGVRLWLASRQIAAVQAHRNRVPESFAGQIDLGQQQRAADYTAARVRLARLSVMLDVVLTLALTIGGGINALDAWVGRLAGSEPWHGTWLIMSVLALLQLAGLPLAICRTFRLEARFGFNRTSARLFATDCAKGWLFGLALGTPLLLAALSIMNRSGSHWWVWAWLLWLGSTLALTWAWPAFIAPAFNRFEPLSDPQLLARVNDLLERCGFSAQGGVYVMDGSRRSSQGNAYFTGVARNKRIVFFDTLLQRVDHAEVEAILAHELGHFSLHHIRQQLVLSAVTVLGGLALLAWLARQPDFYTALGVSAASSANALLLLILLIPIVSYFVTPIRSWWSRRHERQADDFAVAHTGAAPLASALVKLYRDNASTLTPDPLYCAFYDSHPPAIERIARLRAVPAFRSRQLPE